MTAVVVVAAGDGVRLGLGPKALVPLAGRPMLAWALDGVLAADVAHVVVVAPSAHLAAIRALVPDEAGIRVDLVAGGADRQASVAAGLELIDDDVVLVHDAARPLTPSALIDAVRAAVVRTGDGVVPGLVPADTVKRVDGALVAETLDRDRLTAVQTPQGFPTAALKRAYGLRSVVHTDDAGLFAAAGGAVRVIPGDPDAFKITTRADLARAEALLAPAGPPRTGFGMDVHAFDASVPLRLGGLDWPGEPGLAGHSDGDAACHALTDAVLSAGGLGDIGARFGVDRPEEAGRAGVDFVRRAVAVLAGEAGLRPASATVQVVGVRPRIAARRDEMAAVLAAALGAPVAVSGTTTDGLGFTGRGEGLAAIATLVAVPIRPDRRDPAAR